MRLRALLFCLFALAAMAVPAAAQAQQRDVPIATRFCGQGGNPAAVGNGTDPRGVNPASPNPIAGLDLYVNNINDDPYDDMVAYRRRGENGNADLMARIATRPRGVWFGRFTRPNFAAKVRNFINCAQWMQPGSVPTMVVMRHIGQQCNPRYTAGGVAEDRRTMRWYDAFARYVGDSRVIIAFEPDSIGTIDCLAKHRRAARKRVLRYGVDVLSKLPNATIYLEAGASDWMSAATTARLLRYIGIHKVRGFMLNVTHFDWTANNIKFGYQVSRRVGGKPFVVSTSYNGRGPVHYRARVGRRIRRINVFCNVRYRGLGPVPTTNTGYSKVDALLWLNRPGISGAGRCNGAPKDGVWWPARAMMYARYATDWLRPPGGTRYGFARRISLCRLGAPLRPGKYSKVSPERRCRR